VKSYGRLFTGLIAALVAVTLLVPAQVANAATIIAASAVRSVSATDAWSSSAPHTPRVRLTWARPVSTFGATVIGYKIEKSTNGTTWASAVSNTRSTKTSVVISSGLKAGVLNYFRVRAITAKGSTAKTGNASVKVAS
jgi:serine protease